MERREKQYETVKKQNKKFQYLIQEKWNQNRNKKNA